MTLTDIAEMPGFNPDGPRNGINSVSRGVISFGPLSGSLDTVQCSRHGACNCVAWMEHGKLWRCLTCNEGAYQPKSTACPNCRCTPPDTEQPRCDICGHTGCNGCIRNGLCQLCHDIEQERWT